MAKTPTEKELERIENKLLSIYGEAGKDLKKKAQRYFERYAKIDSQKKALVEAGELSMDDYTGWRKGQMLTGKRWAELQRQTAQRLVEADKTAAEYVNERLPYIYTKSYNDVATGLKNGLKGYSFELVDEATVRNLAKENKTLLPYKIVDGKKAERWHTGRVNAQITQGILQGESIPNIAKRLYQNVGMTAAGSAVRNARTTVTSAENKGRMDMMGDAEEKGVVMHKIWIAAHDNRTRDAHIELDGDEVEKDEPFVNSLGEIMYPGDPNADPANVYNCRCSLGYKVVSVLGRKVEQPKVYEPEVTEPEQPIVEHHIAQGKDISDTWKRRANEFDFEIEDVINAQGFDGVPQVVSPEEFDKAVKESNFIAQRTYSAPDQETLDAYRDQLYHGKWYVDCSTGGAQYGQGMYCAADYTGTLSDGIKDEMRHYVGLGETRYKGRTIFDVPKETQDKWIDETITRKFGKEALNDKDLRTVIESEVLPSRNIPFNKVMDAHLAIGEDKYDYMKAVIELREKKTESFSYVETLTLTRDANVITHSDLMTKFNEYRKQYSFDKMNSKAKSIVFDEMSSNLREKLDYETMYNLFNTATTEKSIRRLEALQEKYPSINMIEVNGRVHDKYLELTKNVLKDEGSFAASLGYDAINAEGHGDSGSYTVILNRTKVIFKGE